MFHFSFFLCSLIGAHFFLCFLSIYFFFNDPSLLLQEEKSLWNLEYLFLVYGWHVLRNSRCRS
jgi:hypothetical protein